MFDFGVDHITAFGGIWCYVYNCLHMYKYKRQNDTCIVVLYIIIIVHRFYLNTLCSTTMTLCIYLHACNINKLTECSTSTQHHQRANLNGE